MYVIYPAEELFKIYETPIRSLNSNLQVGNSNKNIGEFDKTGGINDNCDNEVNCSVKPIGYKNNWNNKGLLHFFETKRVNGGFNKDKNNKITKNCPIMQNNRGEEGNNPLRELTHANLNESLKLHNGNALKLVQTVSEFGQELGSAMESHSANVRRLVEEFRGRTGETRGEVGGVRRIWENLLRQVEADASGHLDLATVLKQLSRPTLEASFPKKLQSRKVFAHREAYDQVVAKTDEKLQRARVSYKRAYEALLKYNIGESSVSGAVGISSDEEYTILRRAYLEAHNTYVLQLRATNAINEYYQLHCLPSLLGEISEIYEELSSLTSNCVAGISEAIGERTAEQSKRYQAVHKEALGVTAQGDLLLLAKNLSLNAASKKPTRRLFVPPTSPEQLQNDRINQVAILRDEIVATGNTAAQDIYDDLRREADDLTLEIGRLKDSLDALTRMQRKSAEGSLFTKVAELQEDISLKRFDLGVAHLHLAAVQAQKELFGTSDIGPPDGISNRKMSNGSTGSNTKHKWLKAFKSLKTSSPTTPPTGEKKNLESEGGHQWREYTYRKITPCDGCGQVLRGHSRQGLRCRACKTNAHADCISMVQPSNCPSLGPKRAGGIPLLRRQKQTASSHIDETSSTEHRTTGGSSSGTRPSGQPLILIASESLPSPSTLPRSPLKKQASGKKNR